MVDFWQDYSLSAALNRAGEGSSNSFNGTFGGNSLLILVELDSGICYKSPSEKKKGDAIHEMPL
jgi:hypothetical protein